MDAREQDHPGIHRIAVFFWAASLALNFHGARAAGEIDASAIFLDLRVPRECREPAGCARACENGSADVCEFLVFFTPTPCGRTPTAPSHSATTSRHASADP